MKTKVIFLLTLLVVLGVFNIASAQQEEITLSTYYPAPYGEYEEMAAENLFVDKQIIGNVDVNGDGQFSTHDDIALVNGGNLLVEGNVGIGTTNPLAKFHLHEDVWNTDVYIGNPPQSVHGHVSPSASGIFVSSDTNGASPGGFGGHVFFINKETAKTWHIGVGNDNSLRITETAIANSMNFLPGGNVGIGTTNPTSRLHINPTVTLTGDYTGLNSGIVYDGVSAMTNWYGAKVSAPTGTGTITNKYALVTEANAGNVGIGTTSPQAKLHVADGTTDIVKAYSSGIVDLPKQSACVVYRSSDYNVNPGFWKIDFNGEHFDTQNEFDLSNDRFVATQAGKYLVTVNVWNRGMAEGQGWLAAIYKNGVGVAFNKTRASGTGDFGCTVTRVIELSTGDYVEGYLENHPGGVARTVFGTADGAITFMSIAKIY